MRKKEEKRDSRLTSGDKNGILTVQLFNVLLRLTRSMPSVSNRLFTWRTVLFGLLEVFFISGLACFHDERFFGSTLMDGNHLPASAFAYLLFLGLVWNGLAGKIRRSLALDSGELLVVAIVSLVSCYAPTSGLFRYFHRAVIMPWYYLSTGGYPDWEKFGILENLLPKELFPQPVPFRDAAGVLQLDDTVYRGFFAGMSNGSDMLPLSAIPFSAWVGPMLRWGPFILLAAVACIALVFVVHRQWSEHEQLSYPIAQVAESFCAREDGRRGVPDVFRSPLFWWAFVPVFLLLAGDYLAVWFPDSFPRLRLVFPNLRSWWLPVVNKIPDIRNAANWWNIQGQTLYFSVVGLAFFVSSEISITMGCSSFILVLVSLWFYQMTGVQVSGMNLEVSRAGAALAYALVLLYTGRNYYLRIALRAIGVRPKNRPDDPRDTAGILAARVLLASTLGLVLVIRWMGVSLVFSFLYAFLLLLLFMTLTRIVCEAGIPFVATGWSPSKSMLFLLGGGTLGPKNLTLALWMDNAICMDPRECLMPYVATGARIGERFNTRRLLWFVIGLVVVTVAVAFVTKHWTLYNLGPNADWTAAHGFPVDRFSTAARHLATLENLGILHESSVTRGIARLALFTPEPGAWPWFFASMAGIFLVATLRLRFAHFPIHPILLLLWGTYPAQCFWGSFLVGWAVKQMVVRFGGGSAYNRFKPVFVGLIAGELAVGGLCIFVDFVYYLVTGNIPSVLYSVLPN